MTALTNTQWRKLEPLIKKQTFDRGGRPRANDRKTLNGILWILRTGAQWEELPKRYGSHMTCWRRLRKWQEDGTWERIWKTFLYELDREDRLDWSLFYLDGSFAPAKKGGQKLD